MAQRSIHRLSDRQVRTAKVGMHCDGGGLYLQVTQGMEGLRRSWLFRFATGQTRISRNGKRHNVERAMGLGSFPATSLAQARQKAAAMRKERELGIDPIDTKRARRASDQISAANAMTFDQCRDAYIASHRLGWRSAKYARQWARALDMHVTPVFGKLLVQMVDTMLVMKVLEPMWSKTPVTASHVRGRIESILDWAKVRGYRTNENPARWRGHLDHLLPVRSKIRAVKHFAALPYAHIAAFMVEVREKSAAAARALEFTILTAARTGEVLGARWSEIDVKTRVWTMPADRTKGGREHRVPLSLAALRIIEHQQFVRENEFVFPGRQRHGLSASAMDELLRRMGRDITVHGFRSSFRDWAGEQTSFPREVIEMALAHTVGNKVETAYLRGDLFEKRCKLMDAWARYCASAPAEQGNIVPMRQHARS
jgi:integrase